MLLPRDGWVWFSLNLCMRLLKGISTRHRLQQFENFHRWDSWRRLWWNDLKLKGMRKGSVLSREMHRPRNKWKRVIMARSNWLRQVTWKKQLEWCLCGLDCLESCGSIWNFGMGCYELDVGGGDDMYRGRSRARSLLFHGRQFTAPRSVDILLLALSWKFELSECTLILFITRSSDRMQEEDASDMGVNFIQGCVHQYYLGYVLLRKSTIFKRITSYVVVKWHTMFRLSSVSRVFGGRFTALQESLPKTSLRVTDLLTTTQSDRPSSVHPIGNITRAWHWLASAAAEQCFTW